MTLLRKFSVYEKDSPGLIRKLINFLGPLAVDRAIKDYKKALLASGPILSQYYIPYRHPWVASLKRHCELVREGKTPWKHIQTPFYRCMIGDAYKISVVQSTMPHSVREKFKRDLLDDKNAWAYLFEIQIASHYFQLGYDIVWYEDGAGSRPEFKVVADSFEFDVECKRISIDASRKMRRLDFYKLAEALIPKVSSKNLSGAIDIELNRKMPSSPTELLKMSDQILQKIPEKGTDSVEYFSFGKSTFSLSPCSEKKMGWEGLYASMERRKHPSANGVVWARNDSRNINIATDPIELLVTPSQPERVLLGIESKIKRAAKQLDGTRPGLITCYLEGVGELSGLAEEGGLMLMSNHVLSRPDMSHVVGVSYCAEPRLERSGNAESFSNQGLIFRNPNCRFKVPANIRFLTDED